MDEAILMPMLRYAVLVLDGGISNTTSEAAQYSMRRVVPRDTARAVGSTLTAALWALLDIEH